MKQIEGARINKPWGFLKKLRTNTNETNRFTLIVVKEQKENLGEHFTEDRFYGTKKFRHARYNKKEVGRIASDKVLIGVKKKEKHQSSWIGKNTNKTTK